MEQAFAAAGRGRAATATRQRQVRTVYHVHRSRAGNCDDRGTRLSGRFMIALAYVIDLIVTVAQVIPGLTSGRVELEVNQIK